LSLVSGRFLGLDSDPAAHGMSMDTCSPAYYQSVANLFSGLADALAFAHDQGIIHRDIKPSNLLLDERGVAYLSDFGLAQAADAPGITDTGDIVGTLRYMAPERLRGQLAPGSDIYALGLSLYELVGLEAAFPGGDKVEIVRRIAQEHPPPLRTRDSAVPEEMERIVARAIAREPGERYQHARELTRDLECLAQGRPLGLQRTRRRSSLGLSRHWLRIALGVAAVAACAAILLFLAPRFFRGPDHRLDLGSGPNTVLAVDMDRDGKPDIVAQSLQPGSLSVCYGRGRGRFDPPVHVACPVAFGLAVGDLDGDQNIDLATCMYNTRKFFVVLGREKGQFELPRPQEIEEPARDIAAADLNGDGLVDLALAGGESRLCVFLNRGQARFEEPRTYASGKNPHVIRGADLDGDLDIDLVTSNLNTDHQLSVFLNDGKGAFGQPAHYPMTRPPFYFTAADLDGDHDADLAGTFRYDLTNTQWTEIWILRNQGHGVFGKVEVMDLGAWGQSIAAGDLDGDGDQDLVVVGDSNLVNLLRNDGHGKFKRVKQFPAGDGVTSAVAADFDEDAALDLAVGNFASRDVRIFYHEELMAGRVEP